MIKTYIKIGLINAVFSGVLCSLSWAGSFITAAKPACNEVEIVVKGTINYADTMKSGSFGFQHCIHNRLRSNDFPKLNPNNTHCTQVDMEPEVVSINPPPPQDPNPLIPVFGRPNPNYVRPGSACEVKYEQYYYLQ